MERNWKNAVLGLLLIGLNACNESSFSGGAKKQEKTPTAQSAKNRPPADKSFKLACENGTGEANLVTELSGGLSTTVSLEGEFCGLPSKVTAGQLNIFFVFDMSGSMALSDPVTNGSCGRLQAAQALLDSLAKNSKPGVEIRAGVATFGNDASVAVPLSSIAQLRSRLNTASVCRQDAGGTNYEAAFNVTKSAIEAAPGQKVIYFISDGLPSVSNQTRAIGGLGGGGNGDVTQVYNAGVQAAQALRSVSGLILDVVYLDSQAAKAQAEQITGAKVEEPGAYLEKIAGSKDRVRLVKSASDLANQIVTFNNPTDVALNVDSVKGEVSAGSLGAQTVKIRTLVKDSSRQGIWLFTTEPFKLYGKSGSTIDNKITLTVNGGDGKAYKATATIKFATDD